MILRRKRRALLTILIAAAASAAAAAQPVARVLEVQGKATVKSESGYERPLSALDTIYLGEKMLLTANSQVVLALRSDGHLERVKTSGEVVLGKQGCEPRTSVEVVKVPERYSRTVDGTIRQLQPRGPGGVTIVRSPARATATPGTPATPPCISPIGGATILTTRPKFSWSAVPKATGYEVRLYSEGNKIWSATTSQTQIEYAGKAPLQAGGP